MVSVEIVRVTVSAVAGVVAATVEDSVAFAVVFTTWVLDVSVFCVVERLVTEVPATVGVTSLTRLVVSATDFLSELTVVDRSRAV